MEFFGDTVSCEITDEATLRAGAKAVENVLLGFFRTHPHPLGDVAVVIPEAVARMANPYYWTVQVPGCDCGQAHRLTELFEDEPIRTLFAQTFGEDAMFGRMGEA